MAMQLTKSEFMMGQKHPALLWLKKHNPAALPAPDASTQALFDAGHDFEQYAEQQFIGGVALGFANYNEYASLPHRTQRAIDQGAKTLFQGRFEHGDLTFICDILDIIDGKTVDLYEIKSSTSVHPEHVVDLAFQTIVLEGLDYVVRNISVIHVNNQYVRNGDVLAEQLTQTVDVTKKVRDAIGPTRLAIDRMVAVAKQPAMPNTSPALASKNGFKEWLGIYKTLEPYDSGSIYNLASPTPGLIADFEQKGIRQLVDIPDDYPLTDKQRMQVKANKQGVPIVDTEKIRDFIAGLQYPIYFLDYETLGGLVPAFDGLRPYQQLPFQYSLHVLHAPGAQLEQMEYLHTSNDNPAQPLAEQLISDIGTTGSVIVWYEGFEKARNNELATLLPELAPALHAINDRVVDLMVPFSKQWYVDKRFNGSASIKNVLPVLAPELSYKELDIQEGATAQRVWMEAVLEGKDPQHKEDVLNNLRTYCGLDTLAMVRIFEFLQQV